MFLTSFLIIFNIKNSPEVKQKVGKKEAFKFSNINIFFLYDSPSIA